MTSDVTHSWGPPVSLTWEYFQQSVQLFLRVDGFQPYKSTMPGGYDQVDPSEPPFIPVVTSTSCLYLLFYVDPLEMPQGYKCIQLTADLKVRYSDPSWEILAHEFWHWDGSKNLEY